MTSVRAGVGVQDEDHIRLAAGESVVPHDISNKLTVFELLMHDYEVKSNKLVGHDMKIDITLLGMDDVVDERNQRKRQQHRVIAVRVATSSTVLRREQSRTRADCTTSREKTKKLGREKIYSSRKLCTEDRGSSTTDRIILHDRHARERFHTKRARERFHTRRRPDRGERSISGTSALCISHRRLGVWRGLTSAEK